MIKIDWKNTEEGRAYYMLYREKNREKSLAYGKAWYAKNREKNLAASKSWREKNPSQASKIKSRWKKLPKNRLVANLRIRVRDALRGRTKSARTLSLLSMEIPEYRIYLQGQFKSGMVWENYGPAWQIDHIRPCASFDLSDPEQQRQCFNWSNTQPLSTVEHKEKHRGLH